MPNPNINWGGAQAVLCNVVAAFGVDNTGATDAGPNLATAFADLAASGQVPWLRSGTYEVTTAAPPAAGQPVWVQPGVTFTGANAASVANVALVYGEAPGTPAYNPAWYALTDIYWDPVSGLDTNTGEVGSPLLTFAEIVRRYGSSSPTFNYGQSVQINQLTAQPIGQDPVFFEPRVSGGGQAIIMGSPLAVGIPQAITVETNKSVGAPGTLLTIANLAGISAGQLVVNTTLGSQAIVDSVGVTTVMQQPQTTASLVSTATRPSPVEDNGWSTGNMVQLYTLPNCNIRLWRPVGSDGLVLTQPSGGWTFYLSVTSDAFFRIECESVDFAAINCLLNGGVWATETVGRASLVGCSSPGGCLLRGGRLEVFGGGMTGLSVGPGTLIATNNPIIHGNITGLDGFGVLEILGETYSDGALLSTGSTPFFGEIQLRAAWWGSFSVSLSPGTTFWNNTGTTFAAELLTTGAFTIGASGNGAAYNPGTGTFTSGIPITIANLDPNGGLVDPVTNAGFVYTNAPAGVAAPTIQVFLASGNFTVPAGVTSVTVTGWGGGGGGAAGASGGGGEGGGGGGASLPSTISLAVTPGAVIAVGIGTAGTGAAVAGNAGAPAGNTTFGALATFPGASGGTVNNVGGSIYGLGGMPITAAGVNLQESLSPGSAGGTVASTMAAAFTTFPAGGGHGGNPTNPIAGYQNLLGVAAGGAAGSTSGAYYGGGGGGAGPGGAGGAGGAGNAAGTGGAGTSAGANTGAGGGGGGGGNPNGGAGGNGGTGYLVVSW